MNAEIGMFLKNQDLDTGAGKKITGHHSGGSTADHKTACSTVNVAIPNSSIHRVQISCLHQTSNLEHQT